MSVESGLPITIDPEAFSTDAIIGLLSLQSLERLQAEFKSREQSQEDVDDPEGLNLKEFVQLMLKILAEERPSEL